MAGGKKARAQMNDTNVVKLKYMDADPGNLDSAPAEKSLMQGWEHIATEPLLDGPVSRRVAVIDFDPDTGAIVPGAKFVPPKGRTPGRYDIRSEVDTDATDFKQVSVFTAVMRMMAIFEAADVLGRPLRWAFNGEQLLVVPRAGKMPNAFYHRDSRSLQFFFVDDPKKAGRLVYTCLSPDIVAHETTHAILDGIAPDLYNATSPQSLAMHEAIADLGAVMLAVRTNKLLRRVMQDTGGDLKKKNAFNAIAQQFGEAIYGDRPIRDLFNDASLSIPGDVDPNEPHSLCTVLTGALYAMLVKEYDEIRQEAYEDKLREENEKRAAAGQTPLADAEQADLLFSVSGFSLFKASEKFKRIAFRALDYLPPGEISFADYGRSMVAADEYSNPNDPAPRDFIKKEFERRGMVTAGSSLNTIAPNLALPADLDLVQLLESDWAAYRFAEAWRETLMIPASVPFDVRPRLDVTRKTWRTNGVAAMTRALIFKVAWQDVQQVHAGDFFSEIAVTRGTTLAIDWETRVVSNLLTTNPAHPSQFDASTAQNNEMRETFLVSNIADGVLELGSSNVQLDNKTLRVRALGQMLHVMSH